MKEREMDDSTMKLPHRQKENPDKGPLDPKTYESTVEAENAVRVHEIGPNISMPKGEKPGKYAGTV